LGFRRGRGDCLPRSVLRDALGSAERQPRGVGDRPPELLVVHFGEPGVEFRRQRLAGYLPYGGGPGRVLFSLPVLESEPKSLHRHPALTQALEHLWGQQRQLLRPRWRRHVHGELSASELAELGSICYPPTHRERITMAIQRGARAFERELAAFRQHIPEHRRQGRSPFVAGPRRHRAPV
jgi:hypothetical protein